MRSIKISSPNVLMMVSSTRGLSSVIVKIVVFLLGEVGGEGLAIEVFLRKDLNRFCPALLTLLTADDAKDSTF